MEVQGSQVPGLCLVGGWGGRVWPGKAMGRWGVRIPHLQGWRAQSLAPSGTSKLSVWTTTHPHANLLNNHTLS